MKSTKKPTNVSLCLLFSPLDFLRLICFMSLCRFDSASVGDDGLILIWGPQAQQQLPFQQQSDMMMLPTLSFHLLCSLSGYHEGTIYSCDWSQLGYERRHLHPDFAIHQTVPRPKGKGKERRVRKKPELKAERKAQMVNVIRE